MGFQYFSLEENKSASIWHRESDQLAEEVSEPANKTLERAWQILLHEGEGDVALAISLGQSCPIMSSNVSGSSL